MREAVGSGEGATTGERGSIAATARELRRFNRAHTLRVGALDDSFLHTGRPLGENRLLFEIGPVGEVGVLELRRRLGLDSGYTSRLLHRLAGAGLVDVCPDPADRRRRIAQLTPAGREAWTDLDRRSDTIAAHLVAPLDDRRRARLADALATADRLLRAASVTFDVVDPRSDDALIAMGHYFDELDERFPDGFDPGDTLVADAPAMTEPNGVFVVARSDGETVACGGLQRLDPAGATITTAEIKRMWVAPAWRGTGLGGRILDCIEGHAARRGHRRIVLDTNATLHAAIALYERAGYQPVARYNDNPYAERWFAKDITDPAAATP